MARAHGRLAINLRAPIAGATISRARSTRARESMQRSVRVDAARTHGGHMLGGRSWDEWIAQYSHSHQHRVNRVCHTVGIPMIVVALLLGVVALFVDGLWPVPVALFIAGWVFQFVGHA